MERLCKDRHGKARRITRLRICIIPADFLWVRYHFSALAQQKRLICLPNEAFLNDVCPVGQMMLPAAMSRFADDACLRAHRANIASLRHEVTQHHFGAQAEIHHQPPEAAASLTFNHFGLMIDIVNRKEQYCDLHNVDTYWTAERILSAQDRFRVLPA